MRAAWAIPAASISTLLLCLFLGRSSTPPLPKPDLRFDGDRAFADLKDLVGTFGPRPSGSPRSRDVARWIRDRFEADGVDARVSSGHVRGEPVHNAIAMFPGKSDRYLVVLGHHDSVPSAPGAEDNASAVAALLGLARALKGRPLGHTVVLCATDAEETGGAGAELLLADLGKERVAKTDACIGLEMLAWQNGAPVMHALNRNYTLQTPNFAPGALPATIAAAAPEHVPLGDPRLPLAVQAFSRSITAGTGSDDIFFLREGVPALFFSRSSLSRFYPQYHTAEDTPDRLSPKALHSSGRILEAAVLALDAAPPEREGPRDYLLWRTSLLTQRLLAAVALVPAVGLLVLALALRRRDLRASLGAGLLFLPLLSAAARFQPVLLLAAWPLGVTYGALVAVPSRRARLVLFWFGALPAVALALVFAGGWISFGVIMPAEDAIPLLVSGSFAVAGYALGRNGLRPAPVEPVDEPPGPGRVGKE